MTKDNWSDILFEVECFLTTLTFIVLKFTSILTWSWFWILLPMWVLIIVKVITYKKQK